MKRSLPGLVWLLPLDRADAADWPVTLPEDRT